MYFDYHHHFFNPDEPSCLAYQIPEKKDHISHSIESFAFIKDQVKKQAYLAMKELHGWCSEYKAGILIDLIMEHRVQTIVEIGVFGGKSLIPMAFALKQNGEGMIYGVDPWSHLKSIEGMEGKHRDWWYSVDHEKILAHLTQKIVKFQLSDYIHLIQATSLDAPAIEEIDILHIDGNHSEETSYLDVTKWVPLVKKGGMIIFDDINWETTSKAVNWLDKNCVKQIQIESDNIWGIWIKP